MPRHHSLAFAKDFREKADTVLHQHLSGGRPPWDRKGLGWVQEFPRARRREQHKEDFIKVLKVQRSTEMPLGEQTARTSGSPVGNSIRGSTFN